MLVVLNGLSNSGCQFHHHQNEWPHWIICFLVCDLAMWSYSAIFGCAEWIIMNKIITYLANMYIRILLGLKVKDCNSGYRCFKGIVLEKINLNNIESKGPAIVQEILFKTHLKGFKIKEIPITFIDRTKGKSKLGINQMAIGYFMVLKLKIQHLLGLI